MRGKRPCIGGCAAVSVQQGVINMSQWRMKLKKSYDEEKGKRARTRRRFFAAFRSPLTPIIFHFLGLYLCVAQHTTKAALERLHSFNC